MERELYTVAGAARILRVSAERQAIMDHAAKLFAISSPAVLNKWQQLEILMARWRDIERISQQRGPFIHALSYTNARQIL
jgi:hypothetical protein